MSIVRVGLEERSYNIHIGPGFLSKLGSLLKDEFPHMPRILIIGDENTLPLFGTEVSQSLTREGFTVATHQVPAGEGAKDVQEVLFVAAAALDFGLGRDDLMLALGGGVVGDLAGYCAASYMRGVPFVQLPTTLLAQVDSSIGGKVAVNHPGGKNLLGFFYQPRLVLIDVNTLNSLPLREFRSGLMEIIKHGVILDAQLFAFLEESISPGGQVPSERVSSIIAWSCRVKRDVVTQDEREEGLRMVLNFGHTLGHALEKCAGYGFLTHGEAVGLGMVFACRLALHLRFMPVSQAERVETLVKRAGFSLIPSEVKTEDVLKVMAGDKKKRRGEVPFILPRNIGRVEVVTGTPPGKVKMVLEEFMGDFREG